jgi:hypothetical protein
MRKRGVYIMSQVFTVYQIDLRDIKDLINEEGWDCHVKSVAYCQATLHNDPSVSVMHFDSCYTKVAEIVADDLDHVFEIGNIGPEDRITRLSRMHSLSVSDIIEDVEGNRTMVARTGFIPLEEVA